VKHPYLSDASSWGDSEAILRLATEKPTVNGPGNAGVAPEEGAATEKIWL
jgi:hypothetical protein